MATASYGGRTGGKTMSTLADQLKMKYGFDKVRVSQEPQYRSVVIAFYKDNQVVSNVVGSHIISMMGTPNFYQAIDQIAAKAARQLNAVSSGYNVTYSFTPGGPPTVSMARNMSTLDLRDNAIESVADVQFLMNRYERDNRGVRVETIMLAPDQYARLRSTEPSYEPRDQLLGCHVEVRPQHA